LEFLDLHLAGKSKFKGISALAMVAVCFFAMCGPSSGVSNVVLGGTAAGFAVLSAGAPNAAPLTSAPGITDGSFAPVAVETADGFTQTCDLGTLSNGDGSNSIARMSLRQRGNVPCHVSASVSTFTANNLAYNGTPLTGQGSQLSFVQLGNMPVTSGNRGNTSGFSYGPRFTSGTDTLATLNGGLVAAVTGSKDTFASFSVPPSLNGNSNHPQNWVEDTATFAVPTGFVWSPTGPGPNNFSITIQFGVYAGP
jgi:hypothetical protein